MNKEIGTSTADPQQARVYAAEDAIIDCGPRFARWDALVQFVESVVTDPLWIDHFEGAPIEVQLRRRSRSARSSLADSRGVVWIRDGSWNAATVLHELAHIAAPGDGHGPAFVTAELLLIRRWCGFHAYGALRSALDELVVAYDTAVLSAW